MSHNVLIMCVGDHITTSYLTTDRKTEIIWKVTSSNKKRRDDFLALIVFDQLLFVFLFLLRNSSNLKPELLINSSCKSIKFKEWRNQAAQTKNCSHACGKPHNFKDYGTAAWTYPPCGCLIIIACTLLQLELWHIPE